MVGIVNMYLCVSDLGMSLHATYHFCMQVSSVDCGCSLEMSLRILGVAGDRMGVT